ncbi:HD domain-containing phosphohydrolase [Thalassomonas actiniarum]|uniref:Response regulator n=1 Tax=Thalassomonas actiniarum TaxID=485447 RepID=A0AAF0C509_9GAMM|nr:HD domain-containing phosphohydrolase [Thalassomonas actiniarum]WDE01033.1 response regulator [Thalassomonas actiniarum]
MSNDVSSSQPMLSLLLLDDEQDILNSLQRLLRKDYQLICFTHAHEALSYLEDNAVDIIMSDMRMQNINGAEFLCLSRQIQPDAIRLLITGYSDMDLTIAAINDGGVYSYINKPWENEKLKLTLAKAAEHYLLKKEKQALSQSLARANDSLQHLNQSLEVKVAQRTRALQESKQKLQQSLTTQKDLLHDVIDMMTATIEYRTGFSGSHNKRIALQSRAVAARMGLDEAQCRRIYLCALLHEIGIIGLSDEALASTKLTGAHFNDAFMTHPVIGAAIVEKIKRLAPLTENIRHQNENINGTGRPEHLSGEEIPVGARIIRIVKDFDFLIAGKHNCNKLSVTNAKIRMSELAGSDYDKKILEHFFTLLSQRQQNEESEMQYSIGLDELKPGDILSEDLVLENGNIMLTTGQEINASMIEKLREYEHNFLTKITLFTA